jgi:hypothetical protein
MIHIIAAGGCLDEFIGIQKRSIAPQFGALALCREGNPAALSCQRLEHLSHAAKRFHPVQVLRFVNRRAGIQDLTSLLFGNIWSDDLKRLVAVKAGVKLQGGKGNCKACTLDNGIEGLSRPSRRELVARRLEARGSNPHIQRAGLDGSDEASSLSRARLGYFWPVVRHPRCSGLANYRCRTSVTGGD